MLIEFQCSESTHSHDKPFTNWYRLNAVNQGQLSVPIQSVFIKWVLKTASNSFHINVMTPLCFPPMFSSHFKRSPKINSVHSIWLPLCKFARWRLNIIPMNVLLVCMCVKYISWYARGNELNYFSCTSCEWFYWSTFTWKINMFAFEMCWCVGISDRTLITLRLNRDQSHCTLICCIFYAYTSLRFVNNIT